MEHNQYIQNHNNGRRAAAASLWSVLHNPSVRERPMCFGSERDTSPTRLGHRFTCFWAQNKTKRLKEKKTKET